MDRPAPNLLRLGIRVPRSQAEIVIAELLALAPEGFEEVDLSGGDVEFALYGAPGELPALPDLRALAGGTTVVEVSTREVAGDWAERWRAFHRPITVSAPPGSGLKDLHVRPPWCPVAPAVAEDIVIDPGQAFGTGAHATTRLCLSLLLEHCARTPERGALLDVGCGSGVLAIAAARLGFGPVLAVDHEAESVEATAENARANGVEIEVWQADLRRDALPAAPTVLANLLRPLLLELCRRLASLPRALVASGLLDGEADELAAAFAAEAGLATAARRVEGEWAALLLVAQRGSVMASASER